MCFYIKQLFYPVLLAPLLLFHCAQAQNSETADFSSLAIQNAGNDGEMQDFALSPDKKYILIANENKVLKLFDGITGKFIRRLEGVHRDVLEIRVSPKGEKIISIGGDNTIVVIDAKKGSIIGKLSFPEKLRCFDLSPQGNGAVAGDKKGNVHFLDLNDMSIERSIPTGTPQVTSVAYSQDGKLVAAGTGIAVGYMIKKYPIVILDAQSGRETERLKGSTGATTALKFSLDGSTLYTGHKSNSRSIKSWDLQNSRRDKKITETVSFLSIAGYNSLEVDEKNGIIFATTDDKAIEIFDLNTSEKISEKGRGKVRMVRKLDYFSKKMFALGNGNFLIGGFDQNLLYIFSSGKKGVVGYLHSFDNEWAVVAADGRMDGSIEAIRNLSWKEGFNEIPLENTFERNFTPKLFSSLISGEKVAGNFKVSQFANALPNVKIKTINGQRMSENGNAATFSTSQKNISIEAEVIENFQNVEEVRLYQNAKLVAIEKNTDKQKRNYAFSAALTNSFGEDNYFYLIAAGSQGIDSPKEKFIIKYTSNVNEKPRLFLLTVGIDQYRNSKYNLNYAMADASAFQKTVVEGGKSIFQEVIPVSIRNKQATKAKILQSLKSIQTESNEQDLFIFYYAGHGVMSEGTISEPEFFLVPSDVTQLYGKDEVLMERAISTSELKEYAKNINAQKQVFVLDACQSAGALESLTVRGAAEERAIAQLARSTGTFWITATGSDQYATEFESLGHGVFTYSLLEGLKGSADGGKHDTKITIKELSAYIESRVPELSEEYKGNPQYPASYSYGNDFPIVIY